MKNRPGTRDINPIRILGGAFLLYLSWKLLSGLINKEATNIPLSVIFFIVFLAAGGLLVAVEVRAYLIYTGKIKNKKEEDPSDEPREEITEKTENGE